MIKKQRKDLQKKLCSEDYLKYILIILKYTDINNYLKYTAINNKLNEFISIISINICKSNILFQ